MKLTLNITIGILSMLLMMTACKKKDQEAKKTEPAKTEESKDSKPVEKHEVHWGYETGTEGGPENWGKIEIKDKKNECGTGTNQSPINLEKKIATESKDLPALEVNYSKGKVKIVNNGHTIQVDYPEGSTLKLGDKTFKLLQFHFHTPSEHVFDGKADELEIHFVHKNDAGQLAVLGILYKKGKENDFLKGIWTNLPTEVNKPVELAQEINASDTIPSDKTYYHYDGSLTTPPCSEGVNWNVMTTELEASEAQIKQFADLVHGKNARPVQPLSARKVEVKK